MKYQFVSRIIVYFKHTRFSLLEKRDARPCRRGASRLFMGSSC